MDAISFIPPWPEMAPCDTDGLRLLLRLRRNAFSAFPTRCFDEPVIRSRMVPGRDLVLANAPEAMRAVLSARPEFVRRVPAVRRVLGPIVGRGLATSEGEAWRRQRRVLAPAFTARRVGMVVPHILRCANAACTRLEASYGTSVDLLAAMGDLSLDVAATSMFSLESATFGPAFRHAMLFYTTAIGRPRLSDFLLPAGVPTPVDVRRALFRRRWTRLIASAIAERRICPRPNAPRDLFDVLSEAYGVDDDALLVDEVATTMAAGSENTALALFWACFLLGHDPAWQAAVRQEAAAMDLSSDRAVDILPTLTNTRAVVEETLRLYAPAFMVARQVAQSHDLLGVEMGSGALVLMPLCMLHRNPHFWPTASTFDPARFLDENRPNRFAFLPFGAGPQACVGSQLAMAEMVLVLARLLRHSEISVNSGPTVLPVSGLATRPSIVPTFTLRQC